MQFGSFDGVFGFLIQSKPTWGCRGLNYTLSDIDYSQELKQNDVLGPQYSSCDFSGRSIGFIGCFGGVSRIWGGGGGTTRKDSFPPKSPCTGRGHLFAHS